MQCLRKRPQMTVLYGSESGHAKRFARHLESTFNVTFWTKFSSLNKYEFVLDSTKPQFLAIVTSTFGNGEAPSNAEVLSLFVIEKKVQMILLSDFQNLITRFSWYFTDQNDYSYLYPNDIQSKNNFFFFSYLTWDWREWLKKMKRIALKKTIGLISTLTNQNHSLITSKNKNEPDFLLTRQWIWDCSPFGPSAQWQSSL